MNPGSSLIPHSHADEIDLFELLQALWAQRFLILLLTVVVTAGAAAYAFLATPEYEVQSILRPAQLRDLDELSVSGLYELTPEEALKRVGATLDSYETRFAFFQANPDLFKSLHKPDRSLEQAFDVFARESFQVLRPDPKGSDSLPFVGFQLHYPAGMDGVAIVNGMIQFAVQLERQRIAEDLDVMISNRLHAIERQIEAARAGYEASKAAKIAELSEADALKRAQLQDELEALRQELRARRNNRIAQLDEAIRIATALGIAKPTTPTNLAQEVRSSSGNVIRTEVNNQQIPLYFMGTEVLEAERDALLKRRSDDFTEPRIAQIAKELKLLEHNREIEVLKAREDEDLFLATLAKLREEAAWLRGLKFDLTELGLVRVDQPAVEPLSPVKPKKALVLVLGAVLGSMLGIFVALIRGMLKKRMPSESVVAAGSSEQALAQLHHLQRGQLPSEPGK